LFVYIYLLNEKLLNFSFSSQFFIYQSLAETAILLRLTAVPGPYSS